MPECRACGETFEPRTKNQLYCSKQCKRRMKYLRATNGRQRDRQRRQCQVCGQFYVSKRFNQIFCSPPCKTYVLNKRRIDRNRKNSIGLFHEGARVSPEMIARRAAAIRATWKENGMKQGGRRH